MKHKIIIGGKESELEWTNKAAKRFRYRLSTIGGHPTTESLTNPATADAAWAKILWSLLPAKDHARFPTVEDLYVEIDHETESEAIGEAINGLFDDMTPTPQKKRSSRKSPSRKSN